jgi:regulator of cell morphogenesis and NO signaling
MSHSTVEFSPPGTPLLDRTVGELVAERPGRSRIFQAHSIDFCCQGNRTLREACERKNVPAATIVGELEKESAEKTSSVENPAELAPHQLCQYIVENHHGYLRKELPRLHAMSERVAHVHGGHTPSLVEVYRVFCEMANELASHVLKEEEILFPAVSSMSRGEPVSGSIEGPITVMMQEHDEAGAALAKLRELTDGFQPPAQACNTYRALFAGLRELEEDLHCHIHLENSVLFPAARAMAASA